MGHGTMFLLQRHYHEDGCELLRLRGAGAWASRVFFLPVLMGQACAASVEAHPYGAGSAREPRSFLAQT